jgi:DNA invertase Pin-like site-specific DNA recombinase
VLAVFAEHERDQISARTKQALAAAKERGVKLGGPKLSQASALGVASNQAKADQFAANTLPVIREIQANGVTSLRGIARVLNARGIPSARGTPWSPVAVSNVIKRSIVGAPRPAA